jgi:hypothetical protein
MLDMMQITVNLNVMQQLLSTVKVMQPHPGAVLSNVTTYHFDASGIFTIPLKTPIELGSYDKLWVAIEWVQTEETAYIAVMDTGPAADGKGAGVLMEPGLNCRYMVWITTGQLEQSSKVKETQSFPF